MHLNLILDILSTKAYGGGNLFLTIIFASCFYIINMLLYLMSYVIIQVLNIVKMNIKTTEAVVHTIVMLLLL